MGNETNNAGLYLMLKYRPTLLIFGNTISGTEASMGSSRLPNPDTVAGMTKKKIINIAWLVLAADDEYCWWMYMAYLLVSAMEYA